MEFHRPYLLRALYKSQAIIFQQDAPQQQCYFTPNVRQFRKAQLVKSNLIQFEKFDKYNFVAKKYKIQQLKYPLSIFGLLQFILDDRIIYEMGAIIQQNFVITLFHQNELQSIKPHSITYYAAFSQNKYHASFSCSKVITNSNHKIMIIQIQSPETKIAQIYGTINISSTEVRYGRRGNSEIFTYQLDQSVLTLVGYQINERNLFQKSQRKTEIMIESKDGNFDLKELINHGKNVGINHIKQCSWAGSERYCLDLYQKKLTQHDFIWITNQNWSSLTHLNFNLSNIRKEFIHYFQHFDMKSLQILNLSQNNIGPEGMFYLSKISIPELIKLELTLSLITDKGCKYLQHSKWPKLEIIDLTFNELTDEGALYLSRANWPLLTDLNLEDNQINDNGCKHLIAANWKLLKRIVLASNLIGDQGCKWISKSQWFKLKKLDLCCNRISDCGCRWLHKGRWKYLIELCLQQNKLLTPAGYEYITKMNCPNIRKIALSIRFRYLLGSNNLAKGNFPLLSKLQLLNDSQSQEEIEGSKQNFLTILRNSYNKCNASMKYLQ